MSHFVSADAADYVSLEQKLLVTTAEDGGDGIVDSVAVEVPAVETHDPWHHRKTTHGMPDEGIAAAVLHGAPSLRSRDARKLGTWDGVFMPVTLNVLGIILFLRFGFILGQVGLVGAIFLLMLSYGVDTLTVLNLNAISTNGQVRGGGAYYLISRSLGPEFGGSVGLVFFLGQAFNATMNVLGCVESLTGALGYARGAIPLLPDGPWAEYLYGSMLLWASTLICFFGSSFFARATLMLAVVLSVAVFSIIVSSALMPPFVDAARHIHYTSWSLTTFFENMWPHFTAGADGSSISPQKETWRSVFGVLFPAVCGVLAGASMSGDLRKPSKSIPKGTNCALLFTFLLYVFVFILMAATISRASLYENVRIISAVSRWPGVILLGELASCGFSALMGVMACAKILQAIARDDLLPILGVFAQGTAAGDVPVYALLATCILCQLTLLLDQINLIAQLVTMTTLLTFAVLCAATFALKAGGAPSFRPSFRYWNIWTAGAGTLVSFAAMLFADPYVASVCVVFAAVLFILIQVLSSPKPWGDVSHNVTYHFVRKYLLRLDERKGHVKYWRPQILLLANNPRTEWNLIMFCNSLKKGALYILGHVLKGDFHACLPELHKQHLAWLKLVDVSKVKAFVDIVVADNEREGARNLILSAGLGGMRPNIIVLGFPSEMQLPSEVHRGPISTRTCASVPTLPTDASRLETPIACQTYVGILEDALALNKALAMAYGFDALHLPGPSSVAHYQRAAQDQYIDLWPIQIANRAERDEPRWDTYTMVLQLGTILSFTGTWKEHKLRVSVFVEHAEEIETERVRVRKLLDNLRIPASLRVFCLASGKVARYDAIALGKRALDAQVAAAFQDDAWWHQVCAARQARDASAIPHSAPIQLSRAHVRHDCIPHEHLAYHYSNIRLGLAHPRAHSTEETDSDDGQSEYEDDLEDTLANLAVDWDPTYQRAMRPLAACGAGTSYGALSVSQRTVTPITVQTAPAQDPPAPEQRIEANSTPTASRRASFVPAMGSCAVRFNDLPNQAQYMILNELIRTNSGNSTSVVFTVLPAPEPGTSLSREKSASYLHQLKTLYGGGPPVMGVHAKSLTVTMSL
ncbi:hypothetical protein MVES1_002361 [Malassezia vespertilionis]|uniref:Amino acid permease/ SLC12A domain-containing protein n=1 Tax=Malassezia vespertilionis TaxID=2020962 RepID=A0A2N1JBD8_9BASI|nr:uncharacterized protein MVES1_002361 [Malassezia vespertilionis]PKI83832.1 hypothetical protein MVES_002227 [Malassezia vespertilionis]WFD07006.1 hypothetical protein MVES1_002361 [Malassezia vespertilionis]